MDSCGRHSWVASPSWWIYGQYFLYQVPRVDPSKFCFQTPALTESDTLVQTYKIWERRSRRGCGDVFWCMKGCGSCFSDPVDPFRPTSSPRPCVDFPLVWISLALDLLRWSKSCTFFLMVVNLAFPTRSWTPESKDYLFSFLLSSVALSKYLCPAAAGFSLTDSWSNNWCSCRELQCVQGTMGAIWSFWYTSQGGYRWVIVPLYRWNSWRLDM